MNKLANSTIYALSYLLLMLPSYYLHLSSTSTAHIAHASSIETMVLLCSMLALCGICVVRGALIGKRWLAALPVVAVAFELIPRLSSIPYVSSSYHLLAIIIGIAFPVMMHTGELTKA